MRDFTGIYIYIYVQMRSSYEAQEQEIDYSDRQI
jgi:hypothetical protein